MFKITFILLVTVFFTLFITLTSFAFEQDSTISTEGLQFQTSDDTSMAIESSTEGLSFSESPDTLSQDTAKTVIQTAVDQVPEEKKSLWGIFLAGLAGGFIALLMPCIFPMLPLTVSFFTKQSGSRASGVKKALLYGLFIIIIYVALGMIITIFFGSDALNALSTNGIFNFLFFLLLVVFAASFFGAFEITLPSSFVNKMDAKSDKGGLVGLFFMAFSLSLVSFSCTGPIIGTLLVEAASKGERLGPAIGMLGFSISLAIPFALFAMFPSLLKSLPKSGGWLNSVKVVLGFLELALALKFLSNVDLAYHWNWFDREVFLSLWIVIFGLMGLYLIGKIKFSHDSELKFLSVPRTFLAITVFAFVMYMIPGLWGAPLKSISAFLPPSATQDFDLSVGIASTPTHSDGKVKKYAEIFHERGTPKGFDPYYDYDQALETAKELNKPVLIDFTGWGCVNCREMEANVWTDPGVAKLLKEGFVMAELFVDDKTDLPASEQFVSKYSGKKIKTIGNKNSDFQASAFNSNSQPLYVIVDPSGKVLVPQSGANRNIAEYKAFLQSGIDQYKIKK
ncbi:MULTISPECIES: protein-disulfide reductase DsbD [unclassified Sphingobacterium]|uniref:protein-disulfide reductase DsbD family protein n=1 Tax=unclassified Sphingobacterium TaxID=2609468 RepID=UPI00104873C9|nr:MULTISPECIES: cytochrome c biogenesis protein CcdA [unclassified Sphingobacterium]MCS3556958.1 thiol:disulfide interchange protein DsbD [Sphingobacterium sp. JUb21]TCQ98962.1 thiol:disulfide interchange protein DsbD [Sphingobacterium sp. JUb20]